MDYYGALQVAPSASGEAIRRAYKRLALLSHPDRNTLTGSCFTLKGVDSDIDLNGTMSGTMNSSDATGIQSTTLTFTEIKEAYDVLSDVARRYLYDLTYKQAVEQQRMVEEEALHKRRERERRQEERERRIQHEVALARERDAKEAARIVRMERTGLSVAGNAAEVSRSTSDPSSSSSSSGGVGPSTSSRSHPVPVPPPPPAPPTSIPRPPSEPPKKKPKKKATVHTPTPTPAPSTEPRTSETPLPPVATAKKVNFSVDVFDCAPQPTASGYPLKSPEELGLPADYYAKRAVRKAIRTFFPDVLSI